MVTRRNQDKKDLCVNYQHPTKDLKEMIGESLLEMYPPTRIEENPTIMVTSDMKINYFFAGIKVEILDERTKVLDISTEDNNYYAPINNRLCLALILEYIKRGYLEVENEIKTITKRNR